MAASAGVVSLEVQPDMRGFQGAIGRSLRGSRSALGGIGKAMGKTIALGMGAGIAGAGILGKMAVDAAMEAEKVTAQTQAVLKSTKGVAKVTGSEIDALAQKIMGYSGISDEAVASSQNLLLTFTNIRDEAGKGNNIFAQATTTIADMSVALGQDMQSSTIQLGKALNDPIKGITALSRVGVAFTQQQKDQITALVESGNTMDAQKIILKELNKEFGGSAKAIGNTFGGQMDIMRERVGNVLEDLGMKLIPVMSEVVKWLGTFLPKAIKFGEEAFARIGGVIATVRGWFGGLGGSTDQLKGHFSGVVGFVQKNWPKVQEIIENVVRIIRILWRQWGDEIMAVVKRTWSFVKQFIENALKIIGGVVKFFLAVLEGDWKGAWEAIKSVVAGVWEMIKDVISQAFGVLRELFGAALSTLKSIWSDAWSSLKEAAGNAIEGVVRFVASIPGRILSAIGDLGKLLWQKGKDMVGGLINGIKDAAGSIGSAIWGAVSSAVDALNPFGGVGAGKLGNNLVSIGRSLQAQGFSVGEHSAFGGVSGVHTAGSYHYIDRALDINWPGPDETGVLTGLGHKLMASVRGIKEIFGPWNDPVGHGSHLHLAMAKGGIVTSPTRALIGEAGPEAVIPLSGRSGDSLEMALERAMTKALRRGGMMQVAVEADGQTLTRTVQTHASRNRLLLGGR